MRHLRLALTALVALFPVLAASAGFYAVRIEPFDSDYVPQKLIGAIPLVLHGNVVSGPMGGVAYWLQTDGGSRVLIGHGRYFPRQVESVLEQLVKEREPVEMHATVANVCTKWEAERMLCFYADNKKPMLIRSAESPATSNPRMPPPIQKVKEPEQPIDLNPQHARAAEAQVIEALRLRNADAENVAQTKRALLAYARIGAIGRDPDVQGDYAHYYLAKRPTQLMGHRLFLLNSEHMDAYYGCCVSPRVEATFALDKSQSGDSLRTWANANGCEFSYDNDLAETWPKINYARTVPAPRGVFAVVSCKRDSVQPSKVRR
ncbi:hypothetical protein GCM10027034_19820 [Ramlibacter solisilvae]|uniref:hypothetical protein n=1 Tax=Ramlibacter tataouinensis TaxID=94132 RepID=UPI000A540E3F|nr:hypothetical protein [Ramlibacter tataouinensis]